MPAETPAQDKPPLRKTVEVHLRLMAAEKRLETDTGDATAPTPDPLSLPESFLDPDFDRLASARLFWRVEGDVDVEIPFRDPVEMQDALELEYVLNGAQGLQRLTDQLDRAAMLSLAQRPKTPGLSAFPGQTPVPVPADLHRTHPALLGRVPRQMGFIDPAYLAGPFAWTDDPIIRLSPPALQKLLLTAVDAMGRAMEILRKKAHDGIRQVETMARGILAMTLDSARNEVLRETLRYFKFDGDTGAEAALVAYKFPMAKAEEGARAEKASDVAKMPVAKLPARLQAALKTLKPLAEDLLKKRAEAKKKRLLYQSSESFLEPGERDSREMDEAKAAESEAAHTLALETGKLREAHPVVLRLTPEEVIKASDAARDVLGAILFPVLARAYQANRNLREAMADWPDFAASLDSGWPETALALELKNDPGTQSVWRHRKYADRAISRLFPDESGVEHAAATQALELIHGKSNFADALAAFIGDVAIFGVARELDKDAAKIAAKEAAEAGGKKLLKLVPILNWVYAGNAIVKEVAEHLENHDFYFCALDPADALVETEPTLSALAVNVGVEIAFAL